MGGTAGTGDDDLKAFIAGALGKGVKPLRRPVRRDDAGLMGNAELS